VKVGTTKWSKVRGFDEIDLLCSREIAAGEFISLTELLRIDYEEVRWFVNFSVDRRRRSGN
jgi:hypothetical protein